MNYVLGLWLVCDVLAVGFEGLIGDFGVNGCYGVPCLDYMLMSMFIY